MTLGSGRCNYQFPIKREEVRIHMIELFLSTDGKHTVHAAAETPEEMAELAPIAKALYQTVLEEFGTKAQMWHIALNGQSNGHSNGQSKSSALFGKRIDTVAQAHAAVTPHCPMHQKPMVYRQGRLGPFWSCNTRKPDGRWCQVTKEVTAPVNGQSKAA
jgi:hypothetical protein